MADRYQDRPFPDDGDYDGAGDQSGAGRGEGDPLAELARLIGQTDPFGTMGRANAKIPPGATPRDRYPSPAEPDEAPPAGPPSWMQRASRQEVPEQDEPPEYPSAVHPLQRYARAAPEPEYREEPQYADEPDPSRYDDALYGQIDDGSRQSRHDPAYADEEAYAYQDGYDEAAEEQVPKRRGGMATVVVVLALAVLGTGAAFAYRTYVGSPHSGEPPVIKADTSPIKIVPAPSDGSGKVPDRMNAGDGTEKIVPREEAPVDVNAKAGPRVVLAPMNPNGTLPPVASVAPGPPPTANNGTMPDIVPRNVKIVAVHADQPDSAAMPVAAAPTPAPVAKPAPAARTTAAPATRSPPAAANASANAPLSLAPQASQPTPSAEPRTRVAATNPAQTEPSAGASSGGYMVSVSSQLNEAAAQSSYKALQGKYPAVLGAREAVIKRADAGEKGVRYRAMVGPFGSSEEAHQFCSSLQSAGGQCWVQRN